MLITKTPNSSAQDRPISVWFEKIENSEIKLPRFQRHQAWDKQKISSLLFTIVSNLPLGVALILEVGDEEKFVSRYLATAPQNGNRVFEQLLDGQQRLTALWRTLHNNYKTEKYFLYLKKYDSYYDEMNNLDPIQIYCQSRWIGKKNNKLMPLWADNPIESFRRGMIPMELFRPGDVAEEYESWIDDAIKESMPANDDDDFKTKLLKWTKYRDEIIKVIRDYRETIAHFNLPYLSLKSYISKDTALQVFINMNTNSQPLSQYDIILAEIEGVKGESLDDLEKKLDKEHPSIKYYWELPFLILATSALIQDKLPNQRGMWDMRKDIMVENWDKMAKGLTDMVAFLEEENLFDKNRLPTNAVLSVIAALFTYIPENLDERGVAINLLRKYLWSAFFTDRYENSAASNAYQDYLALKRILTKTLNEKGEKFTEKDVPIFNRDKFPLSTADELLRVGWPKRENIRGRAILAVFSKLGAIDFADGKKINREQLIKGERHYHHVFPDNLISKTDAESSLALNCALITSKTNLNISNKDPLTYLKERYEWTDEVIVQERLISHLIPIRELSNGGYQGLNEEEKKKKIEMDYENFLFKRALYVETAMNKLVLGRNITAKEIIRDVEENNL